MRNPFIFLLYDLYLSSCCIFFGNLLYSLIPMFITLFFWRFILHGQYSACKNYVFCMPECVGNYSISTANGNVEGVDTLAGAGILNFPNIYVQQIPVSAPDYSVDNSWLWCQVSSVVHKRFLSILSVCRPNIYWPMLLVSCTITR